MVQAVPFGCEKSGRFNRTILSCTFVLNFYYEFVCYYTRLLKLHVVTNDLKIQLTNLQNNSLLSLMLLVNTKIIGT